MSTERSRSFQSTQSKVEVDVIEREKRAGHEKAKRNSRTRYTFKPNQEKAELLDGVFPDNPLLRQAMGLKLGLTDGRKRPLRQIAYMLRIPESDARALILEGIYIMNPSLKKT